MFKKILAISLIVLQILTQSAFAFEFQPIRFIQPALGSSAILKNQSPSSVSGAFSFFKISDSFVNHALADGQGMSVFRSVVADKTLSNPAGWRLTNAYWSALSPAPIGARGQQLRKSLVEQSGFAFKIVSRFWQSQSLLGINSGCHLCSSLPSSISDAVIDDALGWLNQVTDPLGRLTKYTYDANGNVTKIEKQASTTPTWQTTNFTYTLMNHVLTVTDPLSRVTTYAYDDNENLKTVTDNSSKVTNYVYDERNMLFTVTDDNAGVTRYDYDINGKLAKVIDAETNDTEYAYDLFDRLTETKYADNSTEGYSYDKNSNLYVLTRPNSAAITHTYDALNRLTAKDYSDSTPDVTLSYDLGSRMLTADNSASEIDFGYDNLNRVDDVTQRLNSTNRTMSYVYDDGGRRERLVYPSSKEINYTYDDNDRLDLVKISSVNFADYDYDTLNRRTQKTLTYPSTDQAAVYAFDIGNQLTSIANKVLPSTNIAAYAYTSFDAVGNRTQMQRTYTTGSAVSTNYSYNDIYELTGTSGAQSHSYTYDSVGNRDVADSVTYTPNSLNQYTAVGAATYTNSSNGNITSDGTNTFGYDAENRLVSFDTTGTSNDATYDYDALGRRVKKTVNSTATYFIYDGDDVIADYSSGSLLREYIHGDGTDEILAMQDGTNTYYYHYDGLGSVTEVTDDSGAIVENYTYDVFGAPSVTTSSINNRYRFTGREYDEESGLYHYRARAYNSSIGRFMQRDPIGYVDSMNLQSYVVNNPVNYIDPTGEIWWWVLPAIEGGLFVYDTVALGQTLLDPCASNLEKSVATAAWTSGALSFGGGTVMAARRIAKEAEDVAYLYQKVSKTGEHLKYGITKNPATRYTAEQLAGGKLKILASGDRSEMLKLERNLHKYLPLGVQEGQSIYKGVQKALGYKTPPY